MPRIIATSRQNFKTTLHTEGKVLVSTRKLAKFRRNFVD